MQLEALWKLLDVSRDTNHPKRSLLVFCFFVFGSCFCFETFSFCYSGWCWNPEFKWSSHSGFLSGWDYRGTPLNPGPKSFWNWNNNIYSMVIFWDGSLTPSLLSHRLYRQAVAQKDKGMKKKGPLQVTSVHRLHHDLQGGEDCAFSIFSIHLSFLSFFSHPRAYWHLLTSIIHNYIHRVKENGERARDASSLS